VRGYDWTKPALAALVIALTALFIGWSVITPESSAGITVVGANTARIPEGETLALTQDQSRGDPIWEITYKNDVVTLDCWNWFCGSRDPVKLCGVGCEVKIDAPGPWGTFFVSLREDGAVDLKWPWGWSYRSPAP
jgi:hypothetical protein